MSKQPYDGDSKVKICLCGGSDLSLRIPLCKALASNGYDITAVGSNEAEEAKFREHGISYLLYPLNRKMGFISEIRSLLALYNIFKREKFIIVHAFDTKPTILARIAAKFAGVPLIIGTIPGLGFLFSEENLYNKILRRIYIFAQMIACQVSGMTIFQNPDDKDFFVNKRIVGKSKVKIIKGSGVVTRKFSPENINLENVQKIKTELCLNDNLRVVMISRLIKYKGVKEYLEASKILNSKYQNVQFLLVGSIDDTIAAFPIEEIKKYETVVNYIGFRSDISEILFLSDIVVLPSYYREGLPRILLEAAAMGKPIVTTDLPGCKEVVQDGVNGFLIPPKNVNALAEAIEKLLLNKDLRKEMGILSRKKAIEEFDSDIVFRETLILYSEFLKE